VIDHLEEGFGLSKSSVSSKFIKASEQCLKEFEERDISEHKLVAVFIDGKYLMRQQMVIVLGITEGGEKVVLGFVQTTTENSKLSVSILCSSNKEVCSTRKAYSS
jgi:transposase-like protein